MARSVSDEELQLKKRARRRLIGAVVLVTTVAVVLPMVLDSEPRPSNPSISIQIPAQDAGVISKPPAPLKPADPASSPASSQVRPDVKAETGLPVAKVEPRAESKAEPGAEAKPDVKAKPEAAAKAQAPQPAEAKAAAEAKPAVKADPGSPAKPAAPVAEAKPAEAKPAPQAETKPAEAKSAKPEAAKAKDAEKAKSSGSYVIQVAALSDAAKAKELQAKLAGAGLKAYTEQVQTAKGPVTRVRVGPYASREAAEKARPQLQKLQLDGKVVPR